MWWAKHWTGAVLSNMVQLTPARSQRDRFMLPESIRCRKSTTLNVRGFTSQILLNVADNRMNCETYEVILRSSSVLYWRWFGLIGALEQSGLAAAAGMRTVEASRTSIQPQLMLGLVAFVREC